MPRHASPATVADRPMSDLNTTPLIDVMLVLLIMFIITIPVQMHALPVDLPISASPITVSPLHNEIAIGRAGLVSWNGQPVDDATLQARLAQSVRLDPQPELRLRPDPEARYDTVERVLTMIKRAHVTRLGFIGNERYGRAF